jgi:hypothetical protein
MFKGKNTRWFVLLVLVLAAAMVLAACGGDDDDDNGDNGGDSSDLSQTFEGASGVTFNYPEGWAARDGDSGPEIANSEDAFSAMDAEDSQEVPEDAFAMLVFDPGQMAEMANMEARPLLEMMSSFFAGEGEGMQLEGDITDTSVGEFEGASVDVTDSETSSEGKMIAYKLDENTAVLVVMLAHEGNLGEYEDTGMAILESLTYTAPAAEG